VHDGAHDRHDRIRITGISATGHHGVFDHERRDGQTFVADVVLHVDTRPAAAQDRLDLTVDYGAVATRVAAVLSGEPVDLIETLAERVAAVALDHPGVAAVDVVLHKPQAPIPVPFGDVAVEIHRDHARMPVVAVPGQGRHGRHASAGAPAPEERDTSAGARTDRVDVRPSTEWQDPPTAQLEIAPQPVPLGGGTGPVPLGRVSLDGPVWTPVAGSPTLTLEPDAGDDAPARVPDDTPLPDRMETVPDGPVEVVLALGSNLGASEDTLRAAVRDLAAVDGLEITALSPLVRTAPVGGPDQPDYLNAVVLGRTTLSPRALLRACQAVEAAHGRERLVHWGPRTVDVDIVLHGSTIGVTDDLELPHPRAHQRAFVLQPWAQVAPDAVLPGLGGGPVAALAETAPDRDGIRWMALDWWRTPEDDG
jgi:dihydroneopterin aldolase / 2-amino-4-hydroxy-6-hydroxymethyldihydropteridine diphosphokinase